MTTASHSFTGWLDYWKCEHPDTEIRWRVRRNGVGCWAIQCLICGRELRQVAKTAPEVRLVADRVPFDEALAEQIQSELKEESQRRSEQMRQQWEDQANAEAQEREQKNAEWWDWYNQYLKTPDWKAKRALVMERANEICEGCRKRRAIQVHHLTYDHAGDEFLFELVAICGVCHHRIHPGME